MELQPASGPLTSLKVLEFGGIGPGPFCGMMLSDAGADVIRIDRHAEEAADPADVTRRGRRSIALDLRNPAALEACLDLIERADALFEGYRPGVMERLGLGPTQALARNPRLVYGRITGWGQYGPYAAAAGHDINYIALSGALHAIGPAERPVPPLNLVGDYGGGAMMLAFGLLAAILHARATGAGQVIDAAMTDGAALLMAPFYGLHSGKRWKDERHANFLDGGAGYYDTYRCVDGKWIALGPFEPHFFGMLADALDLPAAARSQAPENWPRLREAIAAVISRHDRDRWEAKLAGTDVCFAPVLSLAEARRHPHNVARQTFVECDGIVQPAPAPRFSATPSAIGRGVPAAGGDNDAALGDWGFDPARIATLRAAGALLDG